MSNQDFRYQPEVFNQPTLELAQNIVITDEPGMSAKDRWMLETPWLQNILNLALPKTDCLMVDFGCGVGRLSNVFAGMGYSILGVDLSPEMRLHALTQVRGNFSPSSLEMFDRLILNGLRVDLVSSVWVLQHCPNLEYEIDRISNVLKPGGVLFVVDMTHRAIPTDKGWVNDGKDVFLELSRRFQLIQKLPYLYDGAPESLKKSAWVGFFRKPL